MASLAVAFLKSESVTKETGRTGITSVSSCVVNTLKAFTGRAVAVTDGIRIDVTVAIARLAGTSWAETAFWVA